MKKLKFSNLLLVSILLVTACSTSTSIVSSYKAPDAVNLNYKKVFIAALSANDAVKQTVENSIAKYMAEKGITAIKSTDVFPPNFHSSGQDKDKDSVLAKVRATNCDGILTVAMVNKETETSYVPGSYGGTFGGYYGYGYGGFYSAGYYTTDKIYFLQTNLFDAKTEKLVWSAQSKMYNPSSLENFLPGYQEAISDRMIKDGLVAAKK